VHQKENLKAMKILFSETNLEGEILRLVYDCEDGDRP